MNVVLIAIIAVLLIVCLVLVVLLLKFSSNNNNQNKTNSSQNENKKLEISDVNLPRNIETMDPHSLFQACKKVFESYRALGYGNKSSKELSKIEWHTWQVSLLLANIKKEREFYIPKPQEVFHESIYEVGDELLKESIQKVYSKYVNNINIHKSRDELSSDVSWSSREVSYIFLYMSNLKRLK